MPDGSEQPYLLRTDDAGVVRLTLNRPQRFNPLLSLIHI